jgi:hypothetical protein
LVLVSGAGEVLGQTAGAEGGSTEARSTSEDQKEDQEEPAADDEGRAGIGVDVGLTTANANLGLSGLGGLGSLVNSPVRTGLRIPLQLSDRWTLEPRLGFSVTRTVHSAGQSSGGLNTEDLESTSWMLGGGLQLRRTWSLSGSTRAYAGFALRAHYSEVSGLGSNSQSERVNRTTTLGAGPVLGGEYFLSESFSLGLEARIDGNYQRGENPEVDPSGRTEQFSLSHYGGLVARLYL